MGTHFKGNKAELIALTSWIKLLRASDSVFKKIRPSMVQYNLSTTQFAVLEVLSVAWVLILYKPFGSVSMVIFVGVLLAITPVLFAVSFI